MTSSETYSAPFFAQASFSPWLKPGSGGTTPMLPGRGLGDHAGDLAGVRVEGGVHGVEVVVRQDDGVAGLGAGDTGGVGQREGRHAAARRREQRVDMAVVAARRT